MVWDEALPAQRGVPAPGPAKVSCGMHLSGLINYCQANGHEKGTELREQRQARPIEMLRSQTESWGNRRTEISP